MCYASARMTFMINYSKVYMFENVCNSPKTVKHNDHITKNALLISKVGNTFILISLLIPNYMAQT